MTIPPPTLATVGALERDRTVDSGGNELGTFTSGTRPTDTEAQALIDQAVNDAYISFGQLIPDAPGDSTQPGYDPDALRKSVTTAIAYRSAALIELSHFGEQVARGNSPYQAYESQWELMKKEIQNAIEDAGGEPPAPEGGSSQAEGDFPEDAGGFVGWGTRW